jgi:hypothetical protein
MPTLRPTYTPYPTATPYVIGPPDDFYAGDPVDAGGVRFVLSDVATVPATPADDGAARWIVSWRLAVTNNGATPYEFVPAMRADLAKGTRCNILGI